MFKTMNNEELQIHNVTLGDAGEYKCIVHNVIDEISSVTTLSVDGPPGPPGKYIFSFIQSQLYNFIISCII